MNHYSLKSILTAFGYPEELLFRGTPYPMMYLGVNLYYPETPLFRHCLYIAEGNEIPAPLLSGPYGCILIPSSSRPCTDRLAAETVIWPERISAGLLLCQIQNLYLSRSSQAHMARTLMSSLSLNSSIGSLIHQAAAIMQNPILLLDPAYRVIAMESLGCEVNDIFWQDCLENRRVSDEHVLLIKNSGLTRDLEQASSVSLWQERDCFNHIPRLAQKIYTADHTYLGTIAVMQCGRVFTPEDYFLLEALVETLSSVLVHYDCLSPSQKAASEFLTALIRSEKNPPFSGGVKRRLEEVSRHKFFLAGFIPLRNNPALSRLGAYLQAALLCEQEGILTTIQEQNVIVLMYFDDFKQIRAVRQWLNEKLSPLSIAIGLSPVFTCAAQFPLQLSLAERASELGMSHSAAGETPVQQYQNLAHLQLFDALRRSDLERYTLHSPAAILRTENHGELYKTLLCFVRHIGSYSETAQELFIHKNTLLYRLSKIQTLTGIDYTAPAEILAAALSFSAVEYLYNGTD